MHRSALHGRACAALPSWSPPTRALSCAPLLCLALCVLCTAQVSVVSRSVHVQYATYALQGLTCPQCNQLLLDELQKAVAAAARALPDNVECACLAALAGGRHRLLLSGDAADAEAVMPHQAEGAGVGSGAVAARGRVPEGLGGRAAALLARARALLFAPAAPHGGGDAAWGDSGRSLLAAAAVRPRRRLAQANGTTATPPQASGGMVPCPAANFSARIAANPSDDLTAIVSNVLSRSVQPAGFFSGVLVPLPPPSQLTLSSLLLLQLGVGSTPAGAAAAAAAASPGQLLPKVANTLVVGADDVTLSDPNATNTSVVSPRPNTGLALSSVPLPPPPAPPSGGGGGGDSLSGGAIAGIVIGLLAAAALLAVGLYYFRDRGKVGAGGEAVNPFIACVSYSCEWPSKLHGNACEPQLAGWLYCFCVVYWGKAGEWRRCAIGGGEGEGERAAAVVVVRSSPRQLVPAPQTPSAPTCQPPHMLPPPTPPASDPTRSGARGATPIAPTRASSCGRTWFRSGAGSRAT